MIPYVSHFIKKTTVYVKGKTAMAPIKFVPLTQQQIKSIQLISENKIDINAIPLDILNILKGISLAQLNSIKGKFHPRIISIVLKLISEPLSDKQLSVVDALNRGELRMYDIPPELQKLIMASSLEEVSKFPNLRPKILSHIAKMHFTQVPMPVQPVMDATTPVAPPTPIAPPTAISTPVTSVPMPPSLTRPPVNPPFQSNQNRMYRDFAVDNIQDTLRDLNYWSGYLAKKRGQYAASNVDLAVRAKEQLMSIQLIKSKLQQLMLKSPKGGKLGFIVNKGVTHTQIMAAVENAHKVMGMLRKEYLGHLELAQSNLKSANSRIATLKTEIENAKSNISKVTADFEARDADRLSSIESLNATIASSQADYSKTLAQKNDEIAQCNAEIQRLQTAQADDAANSNIRIDALNMQIQELQEVEAACESAKAALEESLVAAQNDLETALTSGNSSQEQVNSLNAEIDSLNAKIAQLEEPVFIKTSAMTASDDETIELSPQAVQNVIDAKNVKAIELSQQLDASKAREQALQGALKIKTASEQDAIEQAEGKVSKGTVAAIVVASVAIVGIGAFVYVKKR